MSIFDYPRVNFAGKLRLNPGTANNDDYAQPSKTDQALIPDGPFKGQALGLLQSKSVQAQTYGMDDSDFVRWIQKAHEFDTHSPPDKIMAIPAEWNYYGDMKSTAVEIEVIGVQTGPDGVYLQPTSGVALTQAIGSTLDFSGNITDINPEGSPPATQFFLGPVTLGDDPSWLSGGQATKGVGLWINFFRNVNQQGDAGAGSYLQHVIRSTPENPLKVNLPGFEHADGVVLRYYISLPLLDNPETADSDVMEQYYQPPGKINPKTLEIVGTLTPFAAGEPVSGPVGRQLISFTKNVVTTDPAGRPYANNGGGKVALAPAMVQQAGNRITADFIGTFPDLYLPKVGTNNKFDFGRVWLRAVTENDRADVGEIAYTDRDNDKKGWLFDFDLEGNEHARHLLAKEGARLEIQTEKGEAVLSEVSYYVFSEQLAVYGQQNGDDNSFVNQGTAESIAVSVYHRGVALTPEQCPPITMWQYSTVPIQDPGKPDVRSTALEPGVPINVPTDQAGAYLLTFRVQGEVNTPVDFPPTDYGKFAYPPEAFAVTWAPQISVRILPYEDYSQYYVDPTAVEPVGNDALTWQVVYDNVLRTYALLFPAMNNVFAMNKESKVMDHADSIIDATDPAKWLTPDYMPRTRDLSDSRRTLLQAWCRKVSKHK